MQRKLDRIPQWDQRNNNYPVRALTVDTPPRSYTWGCDTVLDQATEGACVGFAVAHELRARPRVIPNVNTELALTLYRRARALDAWPGEDYHGTSVIAGIKAARELGHLPEYRWATNADDLARAVSRLGPAVLGVNWHESMYQPATRAGRHWLSIDGPIVGGHAILAVGYSVKLDAFRLLNSWGPSWGTNGRAWISRDDINALLTNNGEACIPVQR